MNYKWLIALTVFLFLMMGASNAHNVTDNLTSAEPIMDDINVTFTEQMWEENLSDISVDLPSDAKGNFTVKINDEVIYADNITETSFKVPIKLPKPQFEIVANIYPPYDCKNYNVNAFYNDIDLKLNKVLKVMKYPSDVDILRFPEEILQYDKYGPLMVFPRSANGTVEFYIDNRLFKTTTASPTIYWEDNPFSKLDLGTHSLRVVYYGDSYYAPFNRTFEFLVTNVKISIPKTVNIGHDDCISVDTLQNVVGTVKVYIDNVLVESSKTENGNFITSLEPYLKVNSREVKVTYSNSEFERTKTQLINMTYDFDVFIPQFIYGEKNIIDIILPDTLNNNFLTITVDGVRYPATHPAYIMNNALDVDVSKLGAGNHTLTLSFAGDGRFEAKTESYNFTVTYGIIVPNEVTYKDSSKVYLNLPGNSNGNLEVYVDGVFFKSVKMNRGHAEVLLDTLSPGWHGIEATYSGGDYEVLKVLDDVLVEPKITVDYRFTESESKYITMEVPKDSTGYAVFNVDGKNHKVLIKNGVARYSLSKLKAGEHEIYAEYHGDDGFVDEYNWFVVTVYKAKIKILSAEATFKGFNVKIKLINHNGKVMANKKVTITVGKKKYIVKTNKKGIAVLNKKIALKTKKSKIKVKFMTSKASKTLKVKKISLKAKKTSKRLILKAYVKNTGKKVTFKINKKTYKVITKKGIAKLSVKKPKGKIKITATYLKDTVKMTI